MNDPLFVDYVADHLADLPGVTAVSLGGSRASGVHTHLSDWDFGVYYRDRFDPEDLRALAWEGEVSEVGGWGGGVFMDMANSPPAVGYARAAAARR